MQKSGIYKITNITTLKYYIGSSINLKQRFYTHISKLIKKKHNNPHLQASFNKYGEKDFKFEILLECPPEKEYLLSFEQYYINTLKPEYNIRVVAESNQGLKHTKHTKNKISISSSLKWNNLNYKTNMIDKNSKAIICYNNIGLFLKEYKSAKEAAENLSLSSTNITRVLKGKDIMSKNYIFKYKTKNYPLKLDLSYINDRLKKREQIRKESSKKNSKKIEIFKDNISLGVFDSMTIASKQLGIIATTLSAIKNNKIRKSTKGKIGLNEHYKVIQIKSY